MCLTYKCVSACCFQKLNLVDAAGGAYQPNGLFLYVDADSLAGSYLPEEALLRNCNVNAKVRHQDLSCERAVSSDADYFCACLD